MAYYLGRDVKVYIANEASPATAVYVHDTNLTIDNGDAGSPQTTLSLTRKKKDAVYDVIFNGDGKKSLRWGCSGDLAAGNATNAYTGLEKPTTNYGYRLHIQLKTSGEIFVLRNCTITAHTTSISADGVQEETLEFASHVDPKIVTSAYTTGTLSTEL
jgi:hypothetical protein